MKIGIDARASNYYRGTGIGTYTYQLIKKLNNIDSLNKYLLFMPENSSLDFKFNGNFEIRNISENNSGNFWDEVNIPAILKDNEIDIYHVPQNGIGLPLEKKCPFVITLHDVIPYKMPETVGENYLKIFTDNMPNIIKMCDGIITVSEFSKMDIHNTLDYPLNKIYVTPLGSEEIYKKMDNVYCKKLLKQKYGIQDNFILYVGGFSPRKNILGLIEAFSLISKKCKNLSLVIIGKKGKSYALYKTEAEKLGISSRVVFPGFISLNDLPIFYNAAEVFVYPSFYEGFGLPPIESMACGTPVVTSNVTSMPEIVKDAAIKVNPYNTHEIADAIQNLLDDSSLRNTFIKKGFKRASELSLEKTARYTLDSYFKILASIGIS